MLSRSVLYGEAHERLRTRQRIVEQLRLANEEVVGLRFAHQRGTLDLARDALEGPGFGRIDEVPDRAAAKREHPVLDGPSDTSITPHHLLERMLRNAASEEVDEVTARMLRHTPPFFSHRCRWTPPTMGF